MFLNTDIRVHLKLVTDALKYKMFLDPFLLSFFLLIFCCFSLALGLPNNFLFKARYCLCINIYTYALNDAILLYRGFNLPLSGR